MKKLFETRNELLDELPKNLIVSELGVFEGEFSKIILEKCKPKKLMLVDLFDGNFGSGDKDGKNYHYVNLDEEYKKIKSSYDGNPSVEVIKSSTLDFLNSLPDEHLDIVYIDADHSYKSVLEDLRLSLKKVKKNGFICGHDYVPRTQAQKAVDDFCLETNLEIEYLTKDGCPSFCIIKK